MTTTAEAAKRISIQEWEAASTEQRSRWLQEGVLVREEDLPALDEIVRSQRLRFGF
jgi:hypothetical protein